MADAAATMSSVPSNSKVSEPLRGIFPAETCLGAEVGRGGGHDQEVVLRELAEDGFVHLGGGLHVDAAGGGGKGEGDRAEDGGDAVAAGRGRR